MMKFNFWPAKIFLLLSLLTTNTLAATTFPSYYCPKTYRMVKLGDSLEIVRTACGDPTTTLTQEVKDNNNAISTIQWIYTLGPVDLKNIASVPSLTISFRDQKVIKVEKNGLALNDTGFCSMNGAVNMGDTMEKVLSTCGNPGMVNTQQEANPIPKLVTKWVYNSGPYKPQIIFNFDNGVVTEISAGALGS